ncbi:MAG: N-acetylmuramoyl-L-alanine amidase [Clostridiales bacterium]|nr:N-acetylmuramoyl-L-alanine amidase [Clostridiales bacterium]
MKRLIINLSVIVVSVAIIAVMHSIAQTDELVQTETASSEYPLIIIDAGHGGQDGGAVARNGTQEQYINLDIALKLDAVLNECGFDTLLTRSDDNSIHDSDKTTIREQKVSDIHNRLKIIEEHPGCIFISIHQNYYTESKYSGTQVFYSPNNPESKVLAQYIQESVVSSLQPDNTRQIKESGDSIYILYYAAEIAVLVECGFLSNDEETAKLNDDNYRAEMAESICAGLVNYLSSETETTENESGTVFN